MKVKIAALQFDVKTGQVDANINKVKEIVRRIKKGAVDFIVLPEMWATGFAYKNLRQLARSYNRKINMFISSIAVKKQAYVIAGSMAEIRGNKIYNTARIYGRNGIVIGSSAKLHLFKPAGEDQHFTGGWRLKPIKTEYGRIGIMICYDLRFPEVARALALKGAKIIFVPAQYPKPKADHWITLLKARALENQVFIVGANRIGGKKIKHFGKSLVAGPNGKIIKMLDNKEGWLRCEIDLKEIEQERVKIPNFASRRKDLF